MCVVPYSFYLHQPQAIKMLSLRFGPTYKNEKWSGIPGHKSIQKRLETRSFLSVSLSKAET